MPKRSASKWATQKELQQNGLRQSGRAKKICFLRWEYRQFHLGGNKARRRTVDKTQTTFMVHVIAV